MSAMHSCPRCGAGVKINFASEIERWRVWCRAECTDTPISVHKVFDAALGSTLYHTTEDDLCRTIRGLSSSPSAGDYEGGP